MPTVRFSIHSWRPLPTETVAGLLRADSSRYFRSGLLSTIAFLLLTIVTKAQTFYSLTDLGSLAGTNIYVTAINNSAQVVGYAQNSNGLYHAFLWSAGQMTDLGTLGGPQSAAFAINTAGEIVGEAGDTFGETHAAIFTNGVAVDLGLPLPAEPSRASGINDRGDICGYYQGYLGFALISGTLVDLFPLPGDASSEGVTMNPSGEVGGSSRPAVGYPHQAVIWNPDAPNSTNYTVAAVAPHFGGMYDDNSVTFGINAGGQVAGIGQYRVSDPDYQPFLYTGSQVSELALPSGFESGGAYGLNSGGQVVGGLFVANYANSTEHAFCYTAGLGVQDLNSLVPAQTHWVLVEADAINSFGQIAGRGITNGQNHAFLLTPIGTPAIILSPPVLSNGHFLFSFTAPSGLSSFTLLQAGQPTGPWSTNTTLVTPNVPAGCFDLPASDSSGFYRLRSP